jgi:hypothetical protein
MQRASAQNAALARKQRVQHNKMEESKKLQSRSCIQNKKALLKQPYGKNVTSEIETVETKHLTQLSMKKNQDSTKKTPASNSTQTRTKTHFRGQSSKIQLANRDKEEREKTLYGTHKRGKTKNPQQMISKASKKKIPNTTFQKQNKRRR